jgi:hypothetical protein
MHLQLPLLLLTLSAGDAAPSTSNTTAAPRCVSQLNDSELDALVHQTSALPDENARVTFASEQFLGTNYVLDPLGEGPGAKKDPDPLVRFDAVDCVTFVEEVLALTRAPSLSEAKNVLQQIRYRGSQIAYEERNHFMEADWVPNNVRKGFVRDITAEVAGKDVLYDARKVTLDQWHARSDAKQLELPDGRAPIGDFKMAVLPLSKVVTHAKDIPSGAIMLIAHTSSPDQSNRISHVGFIIQKAGGTFVRHASSIKKQVIDVPVAEFVDRLAAGYKNWPVSGFVLLQPLASPAQSRAASR